MYKMVNECPKGVRTTTISQVLRIHERVLSRAEEDLSTEQIKTSAQSRERPQYRKTRPQNRTREMRWSEGEKRKARGLTTRGLTPKRKSCRKKHFWTEAYLGREQTKIKELATTGMPAIIHVSASETTKKASIDLQIPSPRQK